jgi:SAM-dependent methyltransferase
MNEEQALPNREDLFERMSEQEILGRYRRNYNLGDEIDIEHVRRHTALEGELTDRLLKSSADERWDVFSDAYSTLYTELPWLAGTGSFTGGNAWLRLMKPGSKIFEVGSGTGALLDFLAGHGFDCYATEITKERGEKFVKEGERITWRSTDGVHLDQFEEPASFDYVISDQVTEHIHPQDILTHFRTARRLLRPGGAYIMRTPHKSTGPHDLSRVFNLDESVFMHLHEFTFTEIDSIARECGYSRARAVLTVPWLSRRINMYFSSRLYMRYMMLLEKVEAMLFSTADGKRKFRRFAWMAMLAAPSVWVVLERQPEAG